MRFHTLLWIFLSLSSLTAATHAPPPGSSSDSNASIDHSIGLGVVIVFIIASLLMSGLLLIYIRHCRYSNADAEAATVDARADLRSGGLDAAVIESFPTYDYSAMKGAVECAICISEVKGGETVRVIQKCHHVFHRDCIDAWLASHTTCPVCRCTV